MSLSNILGRSLNVLKNKSFTGVIPGKTSSLLKYPAVSSVSCLNFHKISNEKRIVPSEPKVKLTDAVRHFSVTKPQLSGHGDHSKLWVYERYVSAALLGIVPLGLMMPNVLFDLLIAVAGVMHMHWGIEAIVIDYIRPIIFGNLISKLAVYMVYLLSIFTLVGLMNLIFNNCGLANSIRFLWRINKQQ
ncbi:succinate dehydrogenase [ubiquinone] cytochrome b small subunit, mitochondrial [Halyomorpha halys]|uniref:succinate dehydrogenase [ubiquinone] cytochrome b small subunit, mitochondrial n=1 Tax=Halyomorpha halys TaxID=286706 RepID=UPI0006D4F8B1|nr:succinate dehydrogenase [ubiquinone] cytochrome b small subunit, mitochondrial [Halyomorpha halys]